LGEGNLKQEFVCPPRNPEGKWGGGEERLGGESEHRTKAVTFHRVVPELVSGAEQQKKVVGEPWNNAVLKNRKGYCNARGRGTGSRL